MSDALRAAERLLYLEGHYLDLQRWEEWLALFTLDAVYWVPSWKSEYEPTNSPETEMSLIYYTDRNGLEDRVMRATSGVSPASAPLARTTHSVTNIFLESESADRLDVRSSWVTHFYLPKTRRSDVLFGRSEHVLRRLDGHWRIARKKTLIVTEMLPGVVDFYHL